jgi:hypothetical protein
VKQAFGMKDYVVYHNPDKMGGPVTSLDACMILTKKSVKEKEIIGSRVWLITGEGTPRTYFLRSWFIVDAALSGTDHGFKTKLIGKECRIFDPMVILSEQGWFREFKRRQGNFSLGLQVITDRNSILGLERAGIPP